MSRRRPPDGSWTPDGRTLASTFSGQPFGIFLLDEDGEAHSFQTDAAAPAISPDGRWLAYQAPASDSSFVYVRPLEGEGKWQVSPELGAYPRWSADGRKLFFISIAETERPLLVVDVAPGETFRVSAPRMVVPDLSRFVTAVAPLVNWDVAPDGNSFLFVSPDRDASEAPLVEIVLNWARHAGIGANR